MSDILEASRFLIFGESCQQAPVTHWCLGSMSGYMCSAAVLLLLIVKEL